MALTLTFNQAGLPTGETDRGRTDIRSDTGGARPVVDIAVDSIPVGSLVDVELIDEPPESNPLLTEVTPGHWQLEFDADCWGPFRVRATATIGTEVVSTVTRRISIRSPTHGLDYPALAERYDPNARAIATTPSILLTEMNEGGNNRPLVDFHRAIVETLEGGTGGGPGSTVAKALDTTGAPVDVSASAPPNPGDVLTAIDNTRSIWAPPAAAASGLTYVDLTSEVLTPGHWGILPDGDEGAYAVSAPDPVEGARFGVQRLLNSLHERIAIDDGGSLQSTDGAFASVAYIARGAYCEWTYVTELGAWYLTLATPGFGDTISPGAVTAALQGDAGTTLIPARANHTHVVLTGSPSALTVGAAMNPGTSQLVPRNDHVHAMPGIATTAAAGFLSAADKTKIDSVETGAQVTSFARVQTALGGATSAVSVNGQRISNGADPGGPQDFATRAYVDSVAQALDVHTACRVVAVANITLSGTQTIDGVALVAGDRVLVTGQTPAPHVANGIYTVAAGAWPRATDADVSAEVKHGMYTLITAGTIYAASAWVLTTNDPITLGTTPLVFAQYSSTAVAVAGGGLTRTGNTFDVVAGDASIVVNADSIQVGQLANDNQHGARGGATLHSVATTNFAGFMSTADKTKLDGVGALATTAPTQITVTTAAVGAGTTAARDNHVHSVATAAPTALTVGGTAVVGSSTALANAAHVHAMPGVATGLTDGFMIWSDKLILDGLIGRPNAGVCGFRLAVTADDSVPADGTYSNLYIVATAGDSIGLYDSVVGGWRHCHLANITQAITGRIAGRPFDVFIALSFPAPADGTPASVVVEFVNWTSNTARGTNITRVAGVYVKSGDQTRRYMGTVVPTTATSVKWSALASGPTSGSMPIWNAHNRRPIVLRYLPSFSWFSPPEGGAVIYPWGNNNAAFIAVITGLSLEPIKMEAFMSMRGDNIEVACGIGLDVATSFVGANTFLLNSYGGVIHSQAVHQTYLFGYHACIPLHYNNGPGATFYGDYSLPGFVGAGATSAFFVTMMQ